jgi:ferredoxin-NADP reductase
MTPTRSCATVVRIVHETRECRSFELEIERYPVALPGQHVAVGVAIGGIRHERWYSFSSLTNAGERPTLTVKRQRGGLVSRWFNDDCAVGATIEVSEPAGEFVLRPGTAPLAFVAAGSGITPIFALLRSALLESRRRVALLYVNRSPADTIFATRLERLQRDCGDRLSVRHAFTGGRGSVPDTLFAQTIAAAGDGDLYLCGPAGFMRACERVAATAGVASERIFSESFGTDTAGETLLHVLKRSGAPNVGICGGRMSCGTCRVTIDAPWAATLAPATRSERRLLDVLPAPLATHRLACQVRLTAQNANLVFTPAPIA